MGDKVVFTKKEIFQKLLHYHETVNGRNYMVRTLGKWRVSAE